MATKIALYEVVDARTGQVRSRHRTRQAAIDAFRSAVGVPIQIRRIGHRDTTLIMVGMWLGREADSWQTGQEPGWAAPSRDAIANTVARALGSGPG